MNDIELIYHDGFFDWNFNEFDVENVIGDQQLISATAHALSLKYGELEQVLYQDKGSVLDSFLSLPATEDNTKLIREEIQNEIKKIKGVYDAEANITLENEILTINYITITKENGGVVQVAIKNRI